MDKTKEQVEDYLNLQRHIERMGVECENLIDVLNDEARGVLDLVWKFLEYDVTITGYDKHRYNLDKLSEKSFIMAYREYAGLDYLNQDTYEIHEVSLPTEILYSQTALEDYIKKLSNKHNLQVEYEKAQQKVKEDTYQKGQYELYLQLKELFGGA